MTDTVKDETLETNKLNNFVRFTVQNLGYVQFEKKPVDSTAVVSLLY